MTVTYCTSDQVAAFMGVPVFDGTTTPKKEQVEEWINESEDDIDNQTMHSWREVTITEEVHHLESPAYRHYEGTEIFLEHRNIKELSTGSGDKLEVWNGSEYEDYLVTRTEGRNNDYWFDKTMGVVFLKTYPAQFYSRKNFNVRVTYRYGDTVVVKDIRKAAIRLTAVTVIQSDDRSVLFPEGSSNISPSQKVEKWEEQAEKIMDKRRELKLALL